VRLNKRQKSPTGLTSLMGVFPCHLNTRFRDIGQQTQKRVKFCHLIRHSIYGMETEPFMTSWVLVGRADGGFHGVDGVSQKSGL
jgi:hypothetical protein